MLQVGCAKNMATVFFHQLFVAEVMQLHSLPDNQVLKTLTSLMFLPPVPTAALYGIFTSIELLTSGYL